MSRIGKKPVIIPANVTVNVAEGNVVTVKGPKGELTQAVNRDITLKQEAGEKKRVWWKTLLKTYVAYIAGFLLNIGLLFLWVDVIEISRFMDPFRLFLEGFHVTYFDNKMLGDLVAQLLCLPITVPVNYLVNKYWAYRKQEKKDA